MKSLILRNWKIKLICVVLAAAIWYVIKQNVDRGSFRQQWPRAGEVQQ